MRLLLPVLMWAALAAAQVTPSDKPAETSSPVDLRLWKTSVAVLVGASAFDVVSSWGKCCERNSLLASPDGRFGARGLAIKSGALGGQLLLQHILVRRNPRLARLLGYVNFSGAGMLTGVAIRNLGVPQPPGRVR